MRCRRWGVPALFAATALALFHCSSSLWVTPSPVKFVWQIQPSNGTAGDPWADQPTLRLVRRSEGVDDGQPYTLISLGTWAEAVIEQAPSPFITVKGLSAQGTSAEFLNGVVTFTGLYLNEVGWYRIRIVSEGVAESISDPFYISPGPPHHLAVTVQPGHAFGGEQFRPQPQVEIHDVGGNKLVLAPDLNVTVSLSASPAHTYTTNGTNVTPVLRGGPLTVPFTNGTARFHGLYLNEAGVGYQLKFTLNSDIVWDFVVSDTFTVAIGPTVALYVLTQPDHAYGGSPFYEQPVVALTDVAGNINVADNYSLITVSIIDNPSDGVLMPLYHRVVIPDAYATLVNGSVYVTVTGAAGNLYGTDWLDHGDVVEFGVVNEPVLVETRTYASTLIRLVLSDGRLRLQDPWIGPNLNAVTITRIRSALTLRVVQGVATFSELHIDKRGKNYRLLFTSSLTADGVLFKPTGELGQGRGYGRQDGRNITVASWLFNVAVGDPAAVVVTRTVSNAWSGGQPFGVQPAVAVVDKGGNIIDDQGDDHNMTVTLIENPSNSTLTGVTTVPIVKGVANFLDLGLTYRGSGYVVEFESTMGPFTVTTSFDVGYSPEFQVTSDDHYPRDSFGKSVDIEDDWAVIGAPYAPRATKPVQAVITSADVTAFDPEIQVVTSRSDHQWEVQRIQIFPDPLNLGGQLGGYFSLTWNGQMQSRQLPFDIFEEYVKVTIENDFVGTGPVTVTRELNCEAPCSSAYAWRVTYTTLYGVVPMLAIDASNLTVDGAPASLVANVSRAIPSTLMAGSFTLSISNFTTPPLQHNAAESDVAAALLTIGAGPVTVTRYGPDAVGGYVWYVTFTPTYYNYDVPQMIPNFTLLTGHNPVVAVHTHIQGKAPLGGTFQVKFRGQGPSYPIPYNGDMFDMRDALESIVTIDAVQVEKPSNRMTSDNGATWVVTFLQTRRPTDEGMIMQGSQFDKAFVLDDPVHVELPALEVVTTPYVWRRTWDPDTDGMLAGTGAKVYINAVYGNPIDEPWKPAVRGTSGDQAGAAYMFQRSGEGWMQSAKLVGLDTSAYNHFGASVSLTGSSDTEMFVAIGAPYAQDYGVLEVQRIVCLADGGGIRFTFGGGLSERIDFDANADEIERVLLSTGYITSVHVNMTFNPSGQLCSSPAAVTLITLIYPQMSDLPMIQPAGNPATFGYYNQYLAAVAAELTFGGVKSAASIAITQDVAGTRMTSGMNATSRTVGAVYVFQYNATSQGFDERQKLMRGSQITDRTVSDEFGFSVSASGRVLVVGIPGDDTIAPDAGAVAVFIRHPSTRLYSQLQTFYYPSSDELDRFGAVVAMDGTTVVVSAPNANNKLGRVFVYRSVPQVPVDQAFFHVDQILDSPTTLPPITAWSPRLQFGYSIAVDQDTMVVGAPGHMNGFGVTTGAAFVYDRINDEFHFDYRQALYPTTALVNDRVGQAVGISDDVIVVAARANYSEIRDQLHPRFEVQEVSITADTKITAGTFRIGFLQEFVAAARGVSARGVNGLGDREAVGHLETVMSKPIPWDADEPTMRLVLQEQLNTGRVHVNRFGPNKQLGYRWRITFMGQPEGANLPLLVTDVSELKAVNVAGTVRRVSKANQPVRAFTTVYTRDPVTPPGSLDAVWTEQSVITPFEPQQADLFGSSLMVSGNTALIGAPNRDWFYSGINGGAAFFMDLSYLNVRFSAREYTVSEGAEFMTVRIDHCIPQCQVTPGPSMTAFSTPQQPVLFRTLDGDVFPIYDTTGSVPPSSSFVRSRSPAVGRLDCTLQSIAHSDCEWVNGDGNKYTKSAYDFRAVNDYTPLFYHVTFDHDLSLSSSQTVTIGITNDWIVEVPDETFQVQLFLPAVQPTFGSNMWSRVMITDDGDGGVADKGYFEKFYAQDSLGGGVLSDPIRGAFFGSSVAIGGPLGSIMLVGAPGIEVSSQPSVGRVRAYSSMLGVWSLEGWLDLEPAFITANARFGTSVAIDRDTGAVAIVGCPGTGVASFFQRTVTSGVATWSRTVTITPDYPGRNPVLSEYNCGSKGAVAIHGTIAVMGCRGWESVFIFRDTFSNGVSWVQTLRLPSVDYRSLVWLSILHEFPAQFGASVALYNYTLVVGAPTENYGHYPEPTQYTQVTAIPAFVRRQGTGVAYVFELNLNGRHPNENYTYQVADHGGSYWVQQDKLYASDPKASDRFGEVVTVHKTQIVVGAPNGPAQPTTTWDFESGDLRGWVPTGTAFQHQPTYGDNTAYRNVYSTYFGPSPPQSSNVMGRYFVGTYENRPAHPSNVTLDSLTPAGTVQGDGPQGTLTSQPFMIGGSRISFMLGGGCNERLEYVELIVDGDVVQRATGACSEAMNRVIWDVSLYTGRSGQIRIVDASSGHWGHINVDDFRFDWAMQQYVESDRAGAAFVWRRKRIGSDEPCIVRSDMPAYLHPWAFSPLDCEYQFQQTLLPNDKRRGNQFGYSVAVDDDVGTIVVGAIEQSLTRPDWDQPGSAANVQLGVFGSMYSTRADGGINSGVVDYTSTVWLNNVNPYLRNLATSRGSYAALGFRNWDIAPDGFKLGGASTSGNWYSVTQGHQPYNFNGPFDKGNPFDPRVLGIARDTTAFSAGVNLTYLVPFGGRQPVPNLGADLSPTGLVYIFHRKDEIRDGLYRLQQPPFWSATQHTQLSIASMGAGFRLGYSVAISGYTLVMGAPGDSLLAPNCGAATVVDTEYKRVRFAQKEFRVSEGTDKRRVILTVEREGDLSRTLSVQYSTRDVTAFGTNKTWHENCLKNVTFPTRSASGCGDYQQTRGLIYFKPKAYAVTITVYIMDDWCDEPESEYFVVQLSVPGGAALLGEGYAATVRIDDDDVGKGRRYCLPLPPSPTPTPAPNLSMP